MTIDDLLNSTMPILYETECDEWPYAYSGTCFPVRYGEFLFIVSTNHCYRNFRIDPDQTLYSRPEKPREFFAFDRVIRASAPHAKDDEHCDQVILRVAASNHPPEETRKVRALDLAIMGNSLLPVSKRIQDIRLRGFPFDVPRHGIDYDQQRIGQQAYMTNGYIGVSKSPFDYCYWVRMITPIPIGMSPNGMSGMPVYGVTIQGKPVYCGTVTRYNEFRGEYLAIGPEVLLNCLKKACS